MVVVEILNHCIITPKTGRDSNSNPLLPWTDISENLMWADVSERCLVATNVLEGQSEVFGLEVVVNLHTGMHTGNSSLL